MNIDFNNSLLIPVLHFIIDMFNKIIFNLKNFILLIFSYTDKPLSMLVVHSCVGTTVALKNGAQHILYVVSPLIIKKQTR